MLQALQDESEGKYNLWIGAPESWFDVPNPITIESTIKGSIAELKAAGMKTSKVYLAGHSFGTVVLQIFDSLQKN